MPLTIKFIKNICKITPQQWQRLVKSDYPFIQYGFLSLMESSGAVGYDSGWTPNHLCVYDNDILVAAMPLYIKTNWCGEYVFDWAWEEAYSRYGFPYYPKLTACIPFTPATGPRLLSLNEPTAELVNAIVIALEKHCQQEHYSSTHLLFPEQTLSEQFLAHNWQQRKSVQFIWHNKGFNSFDDFLTTFTSRKRKNLKKERNKLLNPDFKIERISGNDLNEEHLSFFYRCYQQTYIKRSGHIGYLSESFFAGLLETCRDDLMLVVATIQEQPVAGALYFKDSDTLYGRYWGSLVDVSGLHFECCYYQGIEYCIEQNISKFNPGTQGEHKIQRGFEPTYCYSNHWLKEPAFQHAIANFIEEDNTHIEEYKKQAETLLPFKEQD